MVSGGGQYRARAVLPARRRSGRDCSTCREIHSIQYNEGARFVRVTGVDMNRVNRRVWNADTGEVREIESVGAGSTSSQPGQ